MSVDYTVDRMLTLRKLTRAISELLRRDVKDYLGTLSPLLRPRTVFGDYIQSSSREMVHGAESAFKGLQEQYEALAGAPPFNLARELKAPIEILSSALEISPFEYSHEATNGSQSKVVTVTSPLRWVVSYSGFSPARLRDLLAYRNRPEDELRQFLLHYLVLHTVVKQQAGVPRILGALHFPVESTPLPEYGNVPVTVIASAVSTILPQDGVIIESTEVSGTDAFEEVVDVSQIAALGNPLKERLLGILDQHGISSQ